MAVRADSVKDGSAYAALQVMIPIIVYITADCVTLGNLLLFPITLGHIAALPMHSSMYEVARQAKLRSTVECSRVSFRNAEKKCV